MADRAKTEEDLKIGLEEIFKEYFRRFNIDIEFKHEVSVYNGRIDSIFQSIVLEYKKPHGLEIKTIRDKAIRELKNYLKSLIPKVDNPRSFIGVAIDGYNILFVRSTITKSKIKSRKYDTVDTFYTIDNYMLQEDWDISELYQISPEIMENLFLYFRSLSTKVLNSENITDEFGLKGEIARDFIKLFYNLINENIEKKHKLNVLFSEWSRIFGIVYGKDLSRLTKDINDLENLLAIQKPDLKKILFSIHTYLVILMKFLSAEILMFTSGFLLSSFVNQLKNLNEDNLKKKILNLENGNLFAQLGITNYLEGDFFSWYLDVWNNKLAKLIRSMCFKLSQYEPATIYFEPQYTTDLLKELYQYLVPKNLRRDLGEFYTPDWLADLVLEEVNYDANIFLKVLDPACGSGTFLIRVIKKIREKTRSFPEKYPNKSEILYQIVNNVVGLDINPLAIISARTNYILALGDLLRYRIKGEIELPIYLCDSVLTSNTQITGFGAEHKIITTVGEFFLHEDIIKRDILQIITSVLEDVISQKGNLEIYLERLKLKIEKEVYEQHEVYFKNLFKKIKKLETDGKNGVWLRILRNSFAPVYIGKFDYVVGNPPWIRWGLLSNEYRKETNKLWKEYGLFSLKGFESKLGGGEKDFSMLFLYACIDYYLKKDGRLSFLMTQEVFKTKGAGEGFRRFELGESKRYFKVLKVHDLVKIRPFEGVSNKTSLIVIENSKKTNYPVPYFVWTKGRTRRTEKSLTISQAKNYYRISEKIAKPIDSSLGSWLSYNPELEDLLEKIILKNDYKAVRGASTDYYGVYWVDILERLPNNDIFVTNLPKLGKKKGIQKVNLDVEPTYLYPGVRGRDIKKWYVKPKYYVFIVQNPKTKSGIEEDYLQINFPKTYNYFLQFKDILLTKRSYWHFFAKEVELKNKNFEDELREKYSYIKFEKIKSKKDKKSFIYLASNKSFYTMFNVSENIFYPYLVVWRRMGNKMISAVISSIESEYLGKKKLIPTDTTAYIPFKDEDSAYFVCSFLNSSIINQAIKTFSSEGRGFGAPSVVNQLNIPRYNPKISIFKNLVELAKKAHQLAENRKNIEQVNQIQEKINNLVREYFIKLEPLKESFNIEDIDFDLDLNDPEIIKEISLASEKSLNKFLKKEPDIYTDEDLKVKYD